MKRQNAFTLVELLVVIGIIAVLISILLPALSRVRESAKSTACLSNLRQIGQGMLLYSVDTKGFLPPAQVENFAVTPDVTVETWATILIKGKYLGPQQQNRESSVVRCPSGFDSRWNFDPLIDRQDPTGAKFYRIFTTNAAGIGSVPFDNWYGCNATQNSSHFRVIPMNQVPTGDDRSMQLHRYSEMKHGSDLVLIYDGLWMHNYYRWQTFNARHFNRSTTNAVFADGHCESLKTAGVAYDWSSPTDWQSHPFPKVRLDQ